jgi:hypothetical protein
MYGHAPVPPGAGFLLGVSPYVSQYDVSKKFSKLSIDIIGIIRYIRNIEKRENKGKNNEL